MSCMARSIAAPAPSPLLAGVARSLKGVVRAIRATCAGAMSVWRFAWARRGLRIAMIVALAIVAVGVGGWQLARHTSLTAVEQVQVSGLVSAPGANGGQIEAALRGAARGMSTLGVSQAALQAAVARYPIVRSLRAQASFPHKLHIDVVEQPPVAELIDGGARTAVAADGVVLGPSYLSSSLPQVSVGAAQAGVNASAPARGTVSSETLPTVGESVTGGVLLDELIVLGAAPGPLAQEVTHVYMGSKGLTVVLHGGLLAYFGDATRPHAKWASLVRVLASSTSAGAAYVDVRLPERPAAGWPPGATRPETGATETGATATETETSASPGAATADPTTAAELAAGLDAAVSGTSTSTSAGSGSSSGATSSSGAGSTGGGEEGESASTQSQPEVSAGMAPGEAESG